MRKWAGSLGLFWANQKRPSVYSRKRWVNLSRHSHEEVGQGQFSSGRSVETNTPCRSSASVFMFGTWTMLVILAIPHLSPGSLDGLPALICFRLSSIISGVTRCMAASVLRPVLTSSTMEA
ncbi:MAG: hypothetical protein V8T12_07255 [Parabacteroides johnsonii]